MKNKFIIIRWTVVFTSWFFLGVLPAQQETLPNPGAPNVDNPNPVDNSPLIESIKNLSLQMERANNTFRGLNGILHNKDNKSIANRGIDVAEEGVGELRRGIDLFGKSMNDAKGMVSSVTTEWDRTNTAVEKMVNTFTSPENLGILMASAAVGVVMGTTLTKWAFTGIEVIGKSLANFISVHTGIGQREVREKKIIEDFLEAEKNYQNVMDIAIVVEKHLKNMVKMFHKMGIKSQKKIPDLNQVDVLSNISRWIAVLDTSNRKNLLKIKALEERLVNDDKEAESCTVDLKVKIDLKEIHIASLKDVRKSLKNGTRSISPCVILKGLYKTLVKAEGTLQNYRTDLMDAEELWLKKFSAEREKKAKKFLQIKKYADSNKKLGAKQAEEFSKSSAEAYVSSIKLEVAACMNKMTSQFEKKYPEGYIDWESEFEDLTAEIKKNFGFVKESEDFTTYTWSETFWGKSDLKEYCEMKVYNTPYVDEKLGLRVPRIEFFKSQIETIKNGQIASQKKFEQLKQMKEEHATSLLPDPNLSQEYEAAKMDDHFMQILQDQTCYTEPDQCDQETASRVTRSALQKKAIEEMCGAIQ